MPRNVGDELLIPIGLGIKDQAAPRLLPFLARIGFCAEKESEFQGHVEPWQAADDIQLDAGNIVDAELRGADDFDDLGDPRLAGILTFASTTGHETTGQDGEDHGFVDRSVAGIEGTIQKHLPAVCLRQLHLQYPLFKAVAFLAAVVSIGLFSIPAAALAAFTALIAARIWSRVTLPFP